MSSRVSLAELIDSDVPMRPDEAVAILQDICRQYAAGELRGIPNPTVIRLTHDGRVLVEGPVSRDQEPVAAAAALLADLLPGFDTPTGFKVPGGLRLVLARATRSIDLPPFANMGELCAALTRFAAPDIGDTVRALFRGWAARRAVARAADPPHDLTISDIRRARRATGLSLEDIARGAGVPAWRLRELEWGYLRNWRADEQGREELRCYARAAGLDEETVIAVAWPLVEAAASESVAEAAAPSMPEETRALVPLAAEESALPLPWPAKRAAPRRRVERFRWAIALAAALVIVVIAILTGWDRPATPTVAALEPAPRPADAIPAEPLAADAPPAPETDARRAAYERPSAARPRPAKAKPKAHRATAPPQHKSFLKRELFRIVIR